MNDEDFEAMGFERSSWCYMKKGSLKVYKNYTRDGSGSFNGYILENTVMLGAESVNEFNSIAELKLLIGE